MEHTKHIIRAVLLLIVLALGFIVVREFLIPPSFGEVGHFRLDSVADFAAQTPAHGAPGACRECHEEAADILAEGKHVSVSCELCHAPLSTHVQADQRIAAMAMSPSYELCAWCHQKLIARPSEFPQVVIADHVAEHGETFSAEKQDICQECHDAHNPSE